MNLNDLKKEMKEFKKNNVKQNKELEVPCHVVNSYFNFKEFKGI